MGPWHVGGDVVINEKDNVPVVKRSELGNNIFDRSAVDRTPEECGNRTELAGKGTSAPGFDQ